MQGLVARTSGSTSRAARRSCYQASEDSEVEDVDAALDTAIEIIRSPRRRPRRRRARDRAPGRRHRRQPAGIDDRERALEVIGRTAELRFRPVLQTQPYVTEEQREQLTTSTTTTTTPPRRRDDDHDVDDRAGADGDTDVRKGRSGSCPARTPACCSRARSRRTTTTVAGHDHDDVPPSPDHDDDAGRRPDHDDVRGLARRHDAREDRTSPTRPVVAARVSPARTSSGLCYQLGPVPTDGDREPRRADRHRPEAGSPATGSGASASGSGATTSRSSTRSAEPVLLPRRRRRARPSSSPSPSTAQVQSAPGIPRRRRSTRPGSAISGSFTEGDAAGPRARAALRRPAGRARAADRAGGLGDARQGLAAGRPHRRAHRRRPGDPLHAPVLPGARPRRAARPDACGRRSCAPIVAWLGRDPGPGAVAGRRHRHHRVGRRHRRLLRRLLRAAEGRDPVGQDASARRSTAASSAPSARSSPPTSPASSAPSCCTVLTVGPVRGFAFFLGLSTILDVVVAWFFTRPLVASLGRSRVLHRGRGSSASPAASACARRRPAKRPDGSRLAALQRRDQLRLRRPHAAVVRHLRRRDPRLGLGLAVHPRPEPRHRLRGRRRLGGRRRRRVRRRRPRRTWPTSGSPTPRCRRSTSGDDERLRIQTEELPRGRARTRSPPRSPSSPASTSSDVSQSIGRRVVGRRDHRQGAARPRSSS